MNPDLFSGLFKGLGAFLPQDDPQVKLMTLQNQLADAKQAVVNSYATLGQALLPLHEADERFQREIELLTLQKHQVGTLQTQLDDLLEKKREQERLEQNKLAQSHCHHCDFENEPGSKFCQQCGNKLQITSLCLDCGKENPAGTRFCSECGSRL